MDGSGNLGDALRETFSDDKIWIIGYLLMLIGIALWRTYVNAQSGK